MRAEHYMSSVCRSAFLFALLAASLLSAPLRVCSDPNNLPFSNRQGQGFENKIAELIARDLHTTVEYTWWQQRRNYVRNTLNARRCDLLMGMPVGSDGVAVTSPYYSSTFVFVTRAARKLNIASLDDPVLRRVRIGLHVVDDTYTPPGAALARRGILKFAGYSLFGDANETNPPAKIIDAVAKGEIDVAIVWGPLGGFFAKRSSVPLKVVPISAARDGVVPLRFKLGAAVRKDDLALRDRISAALDRHKREVRAILGSYGIPLPPGGAR